MPDSLILESPAHPSVSTALAPSTTRCSKKKGAAAQERAQPFSPTRFVEEVAAALIPISNGNRTLKSKDPAVLVAALEPLMGHFTVADACFLYEPLYQQMLTAGIPCETGNLACDAAYTLRTFICCASATSRADVGARAEFWDRNQGRMSAEDAALLVRKMREDIGDVLHNHFIEGDLFSGAQACPEESMSEPQPWWISHQEMIRRLQEEQ